MTIHTQTREDLTLVASISDLRRGDALRAGGKGANLGELTSIGMPVPQGYVILADAFRRFLAAAGLRDEFLRAVRDVDVDDPRALQDTADALREKVLAVEPDAGFQAALLAPYHELGLDVPVAVRSSATAEDSATASFAGMNETFLGVRGEAALWAAVRGCWASLYAPRVLAYRRDLGIDEAALSIAVVVQEMVDAAWAGVMLTEHPDGGRDRIAIEAATGLGDVVVGGRVTPDLFAVDKETLKIVAHERGHQDHCIVLGKQGVERRAPDLGFGVLPVDVIVGLADLGRRIEEHYGGPQDIEWAVDRDRTVFITQARPITAGRVELRAGRRPQQGAGDPAGSGEVLLHGVGSGFGIASGRPVVVPEYDPDAEFEEGEVLVTRMTTPDWFPLIRKAAALVTDEGGATSHAAIVARELGLPGVVGTGEATKTLGGRSMVTVDGSKGLVLAGRQRAPAQSAPVRATAPAVLPTATAIWTNLSSPDRAAEIAACDVDGVGLVRAELMLLEALGGRHPRLLVERHQEQEFVDAMTDALRRLAQPFGSRPVVYRTYDFRTNEFRGLEGGERFEPVEANPMIGFRGCARYLEDPTLLRLELRAVRAAREEHGCANLLLMLPFVRTAVEIRGCTGLLRAAGLGPETVKLHAMAEVPSICDNLRVLRDCGFHGISIGSNDLTQLLLGVDRDSDTLAGTFDERDPAVLAYIDRLIRDAKELGLHTAICGQAPSIHAGFAEQLVEFGIDAISVNPDAIAKTRRAVAVAEQRILLRAARRADWS